MTRESDVASTRAIPYPLCSFRGGRLLYEIGDRAVMRDHNHV
jgi:hypothetical protein